MLAAVQSRSDRDVTRLLCGDAAPVTKLGRGDEPHDAGPPVALIHATSNAIWRTRGLELLFARHETVALPLPGHHPWNLTPGALAGLLRGDRLVGAYAESLRRAFDGRAVRVVGHSTGALLALELARLHPELVADVCVVGALRDGRHLGSRSLAREIACLPVLGAWAFGAALRVWLRNPRTFRAGLRSVMGAGVPGGEMPLEMMRDLRRSDPRSLHAVALGLRGWRGLAEPETVRAPVFSVVCAADPVVRPAQQLALARAIRRVRTVVLPTGHLPMVEQPTAFRDALGRWLGTPPIRVASMPRRPGRQFALAGTTPAARSLEN